MCSSRLLFYFKLLLYFSLRLKAETSKLKLNSLSIMYALKENVIAEKKAWP